MPGYPMSPEVIRRELNGLQMSILHREGTEEKYAMPSRATGASRQIYRCFGMKWNEAPFPIRNKSRVCEKCMLTSLDSENDPILPRFYRYFFERTCYNCRSERE